MSRKLARRARRSVNATESLETRALLATITVTSAADEVVDDGAVTLREAILAANTNQSVDGSTAGDGVDTIVFDPSLNGQVMQTAGDLPQITESLSIEGNGRELTRIRGNRGHQGFVALADNVDLQFEDASIYHFQAAIRNDGRNGTTTILGTRLARNRMAVETRSDLRIVNSDVVNNTREARFDDGIAITVRGASNSRRPQVEIIRSNVNENTSSSSRLDGGGMFVTYADVRIDSSAFIDNVVAGSGAAIYGFHVDLEVSNSTFSGNEARFGGALYLPQSSADVNQSTLVNNVPNAVGLVITDFATQNSVYSRNQTLGGSRTDIEVLNTSTVTASHSFISSNRRSGLTSNAGVPDADGNMIGTSSAPIEPFLFALRDNGGPTESRLPQPTSPLVDAGALTALPFDQRGQAFTRIAGSGVDIGAVEFADVGFRVTPLRNVVNEADEGTVTIEVRLETEVGSGFDLTVTGDAGSATAGSDFDAVNETLTFAGTAGETKQFDVTILDDSEFETDEEIRFEYSISLADSVIGASPASITINSDEATGLGFSGGTIVAGGSEADDVLSLTTNGSNVVADLNGETLEVPATDVTDLVARLSGGNNTVTVEAGLNVKATVRTGDGNDSITTAAGDDDIASRGGDDTISSGEGHDLVHAGAGHDSVEAGDGADTIIGATGNDSLDGGRGADHLQGWQGRDMLLGGGGPDTIEGGGSTDMIDGGEGDDILYGFSINSDLQQGVDTGDVIMGGVGSDNINDISGNNQVDGGEGNDVIAASGTLLGGTGADHLRVVGNAGGRLRGGEGNDTLVGGDSHDTLIGDDGDDTLYGNRGNDHMEGNGGRDWMDGGRDHDMILGGVKADTLNGDFGNDTIFGQHGNDRIDGEFDDDLIDGGLHRDNIEGGPGNDIVLGGEAPDTIQGQSGLDVIVGGTGADNIVGADGEDLLISGSTTLDHEALETVRAEWQETSRTAVTRRQNLIDGTGSAERNNGDVFLLSSGANQNVFDDAEADTVRGNEGRDWFFVNLNDDDVDSDLF